EGVVLDVTPNISKDGTIHMTIHPVITERTGTAQSGKGSSVPILDLRETDSTLRVDNNETIVIAGLIQDKQLRNELKTPLDKIPIFGPLLRQKQKDIKKTDLVIMLTPHLFNLSQIPAMTRDRTDHLEVVKEAQDKETRS